MTMLQHQTHAFTLYFLLNTIRSEQRSASRGQHSYRKTMGPGSLSSGNDEKSTHAASVAAALVRATHANASKVNPTLRNPSSSEALASISTHFLEVFSYCESFIRAKNAAAPAQSLAWIRWAQPTTQNTQQSPRYASPSRGYTRSGPGCTTSGSSQAQCLRHWVRAGCHKIA